MSFRKMFATDPQIEKAGIEIDYGNGRVIRVARAGGSNTHFAKTMAKLTQPYRALIQHGQMEEGKALEIMREAYARSIVLDWTGVTSDDINGDGSDEPVPCNPENCVKLFAALPDLFADVQEQAGRAVLYRQHLDEQDLGN